MKNNIYILNIDSNFDETLSNFKKQLSVGEEIVQTSISETKLVITTKIKQSNLLTDELRRKM